MAPKILGINKISVNAFFVTVRKKIFFSNKSQSNKFQIFVKN